MNPSDVTIPTPGLFSSQLWAYALDAIAVAILTMGLVQMIKYKLRPWFYKRVVRNWLTIDKSNTTILKFESFLCGREYVSSESTIDSSKFNFPYYLSAEQLCGQIAALGQQLIQHPSEQNMDVTIALLGNQSTTWAKFFSKSSDEEWTTSMLPMMLPLLHRNIDQLQVKIAREWQNLVVIIAATVSFLIFAFQYWSDPIHWILLSLASAYLSGLARDISAGIEKIRK